MRANSNSCRSLTAAAQRSARLSQQRWASQFSLSAAGQYKIATNGADTGAPTSAITVAIKAGPRYETSVGAAHCLKNFVFRSTDKRSALRIVRESEILGGVLSSSLSREHLFLTAEFLAGEEAYFAELLGDAVSSAKLLTHEFLEEAVPQSHVEAQSAAHNPTALAIDAIHQLAFRNGLGNSLFVSEHAKVSHQQAVDFATTAFSNPSSTAIAASNVSAKALETLVQKHFSAFKGNSIAGSSSPAASAYFGGEARIQHAGHHATLILAFGADPAHATEFTVLKHLLGGEANVKWATGASALSSNASGAVAFHHAYSDAGLFGIVVESQESQAGTILEKAVAELRRVAKGDVTAEELKRAINQAKFAAASNNESRISGLESVGSQILASGKVTSLPDAFAAIDKVTKDKIVKVAAAALKQAKPSFVAVGNTRQLPYLDQLSIKA